MQVDNPDGTVSQTIASGSSITVPTGEVWKVSISIPAQGNASIVKINGEICYGRNNSEDYGGAIHNVVLKEGDTVEVDGNGPHFHVSGFRIQDTVDNAAVSEVATPSSPTTVPTGETWIVSLSLSARGDTNNGQVEVTINGDTCYTTRADNSGDHGLEVHNVVLEDGDTVDFSSNPGSGCHISGFKI